MYRLSVFSILLFILSLSCNDKLSIYESKYQVMKMVYNTIPKEIPPIPLELLSDSIAKEINVNNRKSLVHKYAINLNLQNFDLSKVNLRNVKRKDLDTGLSKIEDLSNLELELFNKLKKETFKVQIDTLLIEKIFDEDLLFMHKKIISREEQRQYNITGIISFSDVVFNDEKNKAILAVGTNRGKLDSDLTVYFLDKLNNEWHVSCYSVIEKS